MSLYIRDLEAENVRLLEINRVHLNTIERNQIEHSFSEFAKLKAENKQLKNKLKNVADGAKYMKSCLPSGQRNLIDALDVMISSVEEEQ